MTRQKTRLFGVLVKKKIRGEFVADAVMGERGLVAEGESSISTSVDAESACPRLKRQRDVSQESDDLDLTHSLDARKGAMAEDWIEGKGRRRWLGVQCNLVGVPQHRDVSSQSDHEPARRSRGGAEEDQRRDVGAVEGRCVVEHDYGLSGAKQTSDLARVEDMLCEFDCKHQGCSGKLKLADHACRFAHGLVARCTESLQLASNVLVGRESMHRYKWCNKLYAFIPSEDWQYHLAWCTGNAPRHPPTSERTDPDLLPKAASTRLAVRANRDGFDASEGSLGVLRWRGKGRSGVEGNSHGEGCKATEGHAVRELQAGLSSFGNDRLESLSECWAGTCLVTKNVIAVQTEEHRPAKKEWGLASNGIGGHDISLVTGYDGQRIGMDHVNVPGRGPDAGRDLSRLE